MNADIMFGEPSNYQGKYYNKNTGDIIIIKDLMMEDGNLMFYSNTNNQYSAEELSKYIQVPNDFVPPKKESIKPSQNKLLEGLAPSEPEYEILPEDMPGVGGNVHERRVNPSQSQPYPFSSQVISNTPRIDPMIQKVLDKLSDNDTPKLNVSIEWSGIPQQLQFLIDYMDVTKEEIREAIMEHYFNLNEIKETITKDINNIIGITEEVVVTEEEKPKPKRAGRPKKIK